MLSGERSFFIECSGEGDLFFNPFGALIEKDINGSFTVDTGAYGCLGTQLDLLDQGLGRSEKHSSVGRGRGHAILPGSRNFLMSP